LLKFSEVFLWNMLIEHPKKKFGNKPGTKELLENFFATFVEFLQQIQHFLHKNLFLKKRGFSCFIPCFVPFGCS